MIIAMIISMMMMMITIIMMMTEQCVNIWASTFDELVGSEGEQI
jgi:hypothetical protein